MPEDTMQTCPKHGLQFNRAHYYECELCRGAHVANAPLDAPLSDVAMTRMKIAGAALAAVFVLSIVIALTRPKAPKVAVDAAVIGAGLACARTCSDRAGECFVDCASVREDACTAGCMPQLAHCGNRCSPPLQAPDGIAVIATGLVSPALDGVVRGVYKAWPTGDLPDRAYVRLSISRTTGNVLGAQIEAEPASSADLIESTFKKAVFPTDPDLHENEPGRHDAAEPYIVYLLLKP